VVRPAPPDRPLAVIPTAALPAAGAPDAGACPGALTCNGRCVDSQTDSANCGACGRLCASPDFCVAGVCQASCVAGQARCAVYCVTLATDPLHCGRCGARCPTGQFCTAGRCAAGALGLRGPLALEGDGGLLPVAPPRCTSPQILCGAYCATLTSDPLHCGRCGARCPAGQFCSAGRCETIVPGAVDAGPPVCVAGQTRCGAYCANTADDPFHCGRCGVRCPVNQVCAAGRCALGSARVVGGGPRDAAVAR